MLGWSAFYNLSGWRIFLPACKKPLSCVFGYSVSASVTNKKYVHGIWFYFKYTLKFTHEHFCKIVITWYPFFSIHNIYPAQIGVKKLYKVVLYFKSYVLGSSIVWPFNFSHSAVLSCNYTLRIEVVLLSSPLVKSVSVITRIKATEQYSRLSVTRNSR